jgi:preprotein translocase subunit SecG
MDYTLLIMGILALSIGIFLWYCIGKRQFNRRNPNGVEGFASYGKAVVIRFLERIGRLLAFVLIIAGLLFLWGYSREKKEMEQQAVTDNLPSYT